MPKAKELKTKSARLNLFTVQTPPKHIGSFLILSETRFIKN
jgi:hypothetical protein